MVFNIILNTLSCVEWAKDKEGDHPQSAFTSCSAFLPPSWGFKFLVHIVSLLNKETLLIFITGKSADNKFPQFLLSQKKSLFLHFWRIILQVTEFKWVEFKKYFPSFSSCLHGVWEARFLFKSGFLFYFILYWRVVVAIQCYIGVKCATWWSEQSAQLPSVLFRWSVFPPWFFQGVLFISDL